MAVRAKLIVTLPFAIAIAAWQTQEYVHLRGALGTPVVDGDVIRREEFRRFGGIPAGRLSIRIVGTDTIVIAETNKQKMQELPGRVRFHYTGDPSREVFVEGEGHPLWVALFLWVFSAGILAFCIVPLFRREPLPDTHLIPSTPAGEGTRSV
jgi:hypothetical protein